MDQKKFYSREFVNYLSVNDSDFKFYGSGDMTIKLKNNKMLSSKKFGYLTFNTAFLANEQR